MTNKQLVRKLSERGVRAGVIASVLELDPAAVQQMLPLHPQGVAAEDDLIREGIRAVSFSAIQWALATFDEGGMDYKLRVGSLVISRLLGLLAQEAPEALTKLREELTLLMQEESDEATRPATPYSAPLDQDEGPDD